MSEYLIAECVECCWSSTTASAHKADLKADAHTGETGHETTVGEEP